MKFYITIYDCLEAHRTETSYQDSYTFKMIVFQFINFYGSIIYIAFFKGRSADEDYFYL